MQFKFKHSKISFGVSNKSENGFQVVFTFASAAKEEYRAVCKREDACLIDDLNCAGSSVFHHNSVLVSLGDETKFSRSVLASVATTLAKLVAARDIKEISLNLLEEYAERLAISYPTLVENFLVDFGSGLYYFDDFKSEKAKLALEKVNLVTVTKLSKTFSNVVAILTGLFLVRDLANNPANVATPTYLGETAKEFAKLHKNVSVSVLDEKEIKKLGMDTFLAVAQGSKEEPRFIQLEYKGAKKIAKPMVLVGKGITFDSGGISIKPGANMDDMKYDMCGAATVLGVFASVVQLGLAINLVVLVPACENMPSGRALKPGDIIRTMAGKTVEVLNTDAEGRLILCDALHYAKQFDPEWVIDLATLTGACVVALGSVASGLYVNDEDLHGAIQSASVAANDKVWRMPLFEEYSAQIRGNHGDLLNIGGWGGKAGSVTAACFLQEFTDYKWAHFDIAGTASTAEAKGSTGRPFKLLIELIRGYATR